MSMDSYAEGVYAPSLYFSPRECARHAKRYSADILVCSRHCGTDIPVGKLSNTKRLAGWKTRDTAGKNACATHVPVRYPG